MNTRRTIHTTGLLLLAAMIVTAIVSCSTKKNTGSSRWWHSFNARYNTYFNGSQAFIDGSQEKENGNKDNFTEMIPLYAVGNKSSRDIGKTNFDRAIEKMQKAIKQHSIKRRPEWTKNRRKTAKDIEWLSRREYNPFLWRAWLLMGKSQFQEGLFDEAAATFSYMSRLYATQPSINGIARSWLARCYAELDWLYDAEDVITKMRRDTMHYRAVKDWDYALADYYVRSKQWDEAASYLRKVIKHERRRKQRAREWYLLGQVETERGNRLGAYKAYKRVIRQNPPYEVEFNARISMTEVMAAGQSRQMIRRLRRMAASDKNKDYLDQVYYAMGNIYLTEKDTANAISSYEKGNAKATRSGIEKGVLLLHLGNLYWEKERYSEAKRCYGEAIGLLDKDRPGYEQLDARSKILDELVPYTDGIHLQDSLQELSLMPDKERNEAIDRVIAALRQKEKEEKRKQQEADAEKQQQEQDAVGNRDNTATTTTTAPTDKSGLWYFYNPMAVSQGKTAFQSQWGRRENVDDWQRINRTVVNLAANNEETADSDSVAIEDLTEATSVGDSIATDEKESKDPHTREYYMAQIPFSSEQKAASDDIIKDGLFHSGVIFKDKLDNLSLSEKALTRLTTQYADYEKNDEAWYHLYLLYARRGDTAKANWCLSQLSNSYPQSQWTTLLNDPYFAENARFGRHIEDSLYAATYEAFKADHYGVVKANTQLSASRFPLGANRSKFIFIDGLSSLNAGNAEACLERMKEVVEKYPQSEVSPLAGMIIKGVQNGRKLYGGKFDLGDIWSRRDATLAYRDTTVNDTLSLERNADFVFLLAYSPDSVNANKLLYEMAKYNFSNFIVRNFDIAVDNDNGINRLIISGFHNYDEALQYARQLYADKAMNARLRGCRRIIISEDNLRLLGTRYSYADYEVFFDKTLAPISVTREPLLNTPAVVVEEKEQEPEPAEQEQQQGNTNEDPLFNDIIEGLPNPTTGQPATPNEEPVVPTEEEPATTLPPQGATNQQTIQPTPEPPADDNMFDFDEDFYR